MLAETKLLGTSNDFSLGASQLLVRARGWRSKSSANSDSRVLALVSTIGVRCLDLSCLIMTKPTPTIKRSSPIYTQNARVCVHRHVNRVSNGKLRLYKKRKCLGVTSKLLAEACEGGQRPQPVQIHAFADSGNNSWSPKAASVAATAGLESNQRGAPAYTN